MIRSIQALWGRFRKSPMARGSSWLMAGHGVRILVQGGYFVVIARSLGVKEYGVFVAIASLVAIISPYSALGAGNILIMKVARDTAHFREAWGKTIFLAFSTGAGLAVLIVLVARLALPNYFALQTILLVTLADLLGPRLADLGSMAFGAFGQFRWTAILQVSITAFRALAAAVMVLFISHPTASQWAWFYTVSSLAMSGFALGAVTVKLGLPLFRLKNLWQDVKEGMFFSLSTSAQTVYNDIDKTMLSRIATLDAVGFYAAAYRVIDLGCAPMRAITQAAYPSFFREGQRGLAATWRLAVKVFSRAATVSAVMSAGMFVFAPLLSPILGDAYRESVEALRWLVLLPILKCAHVTFGDALAGAGHQRFRAILQVFVAVFNVGINFWLIAAYSWRGACWSSLASDGLLAALVLGSMVYLRRRETLLLRRDLVAIE